MPSACYFFASWSLNHVAWRLSVSAISASVFGSSTYIPALRYLHLLMHMMTLIPMKAIKTRPAIIETGIHQAGQSSPSQLLPPEL